MRVYDYRLLDDVKDLVKIITLKIELEPSAIDKKIFTILILKSIIISNLLAN